MLHHENVPRTAHLEATTVEIISGPTIETRCEIPVVGIRAVTPFKGMLRVRDELLSEVRVWTQQSAIDVVGFGFLRLHVIDMKGDMDIEVGFVTRTSVTHGGRVSSGVLPAGRYATLTYRGAGTNANRALNEWSRANGIALDHRRVPKGDHFACRYESYLTDPKVEPRKKQWDIELAFKILE